MLNMLNSLAVCTAYLKGLANAKLEFTELTLEEIYFGGDGSSTIRVEAYFTYEEDTEDEHGEYAIMSSIIQGGTEINLDQFDEEDEEDYHELVISLIESASVELAELKTVH